MSPEAIVMMCIAGVTVWGGLIVSIIHMRRHPDQSGDQ